MPLNTEIPELPSLNLTPMIDILLVLMGAIRPVRENWVEFDVFGGILGWSLEIGVCEMGVLM